MPPPPRAVLLDLDGTLVDTAEDIGKAANAALQALGRQPRPPAQIRQYIGDGMPRFVKRMLTGQWWGEPPAELLARATALMHTHYAPYCAAGGRVYEGVEAALAAMRAQGARLACVTNKPERFALPLLAACGLAEHFCAVVGGDTLPHKKPRPEPLQAALAACGAPPQAAAMVGDSQPDAQAAAAAGCRFVAVSYGYFRGATPPPASAVIAHFGELPAALGFAAAGNAI